MGGDERREQGSRRTDPAEEGFSYRECGNQWIPLLGLRQGMEERWSPGDQPHAILRRPGSPPNFRLGLILLYRDAAVHGADDFFNRIDEYEQRFLATKWLVDSSAPTQR